MVRKLNALEKEKRASLKELNKVAATALRMHRKACASCHGDENFTRHACDEGWRLAKKVTKSANDLAVFTGTADPEEIKGQGALW